MTRNKIEDVETDAQAAEQQADDVAGDVMVPDEQPDGRILVDLAPVAAVDRKAYRYLYVGLRLIGEQRDRIEAVGALERAIDQLVGDVGPTVREIHAVKDAVEKYEDESLDGAMLETVVEAAADDLGVCPDQLYQAVDFATNHGLIYRPNPERLAYRVTGDVYGDQGAGSDD